MFFISICEYSHKSFFIVGVSRARDCARHPARSGTSPSTAHSLLSWTDRLGMPRTVKIFTCRSLPDTWRCRVCTRRNAPKLVRTATPLAERTFPTLLKCLSLAESQSPTASPRHKTQHSDSRRLRAIVDGLMLLHRVTPCQSKTVDRSVVVRLSAWLVPPTDPTEGKTSQEPLSSFHEKGEKSQKKVFPICF